MRQINENISVHGLGDRWYPYTPDKLATGQYLSNDGEIVRSFFDGDYVILDVRDLKDEWNPPIQYAQKILSVDKYLDQAEEYSSSGVVICCGAGISRSPAIALGYLTYKGMDFYEAEKLVRDKVPEAQIEPSHIQVLKQLFGVNIP